MVNWMSIYGNSFVIETWMYRKRDFANVSERLSYGHERQGTFESGLSNALESKVENVHGKVTFTFQKQKNLRIIELTLDP